MRRFRFRLARLLALRGQEGAAARQALAQALAAEMAARRESERLQGRKAELLAELAAQAQGMESGELARRRRFLAAVAEATAAAAQHLAVREQESAACREALAAARQRQRSLERLRERRRAEHDTAAGRAEQSELDEWGGRLSGR